MGALDFAVVAFPLPLFAAAGFAVVVAVPGFADAVAAVWGFAGVCFGAGVGAVFGAGVPADGVFVWGVDGFCPAMRGTTQAATTAIEIRMLVDLVGCMLSLQQDEN